MSLAARFWRIFRGKRPTPRRPHKPPRHALEGPLRLFGWRPGWLSAAARLVAADLANETACRQCGLPRLVAVGYTHAERGCRAFLVCPRCGADEELCPGQPDGPP